MSRPPQLVARRLTATRQRARMQWRSHRVRERGKAKAWVNSQERKAMVPQRDKAVKFVRQYIVEAQ
jgi:hypothetical protein